MSPRPYQLGKRQDHVDLLRQRVVDAARSLLGEAPGYSEFTIDAVARRAGVARATVYYQFDSKVGLLQAVCDSLAAGGRLWDIEAAFAEPDPMESIRIVIRCFARFWDFDRTAMRRLRSLAGLEPEVEAVIEERDDRRRGIIEVFVDRLFVGPGSPAARQTGPGPHHAHELRDVRRAGSGTRNSDHGNRGDHGAGRSRGTAAHTRMTAALARVALGVMERPHQPWSLRRAPPLTRRVRVATNFPVTVCLTISVR